MFSESTNFVPLIIHSLLLSHSDNLYAANVNLKSRWTAKSDFFVAFVNRPFVWMSNLWFDVSTFWSDFLKLVVAQSPFCEG